MAAETPPPYLALNAALVHGLGLLALCIVMGVHFTLGVAHEFSFGIIAVAAATSLVTLFWSLLLAWRSFASGETSRWLTAIFFATMLETTALCLLLWTAVLEPSPYKIVNSAVYLGLPVFGPFLALVSMFAVPLAIHRARKINAQQAAADVPERKRTGAMSGVCVYALLVLLSGLLLIPAPLYLLCVSAAQFYDAQTESAVGWGDSLAEITPDVVRNGVESLLMSFAKGDNFSADCWRRILYFGNVSQNRLIERIHDGSGGAAMAWEGLRRKHEEVLIQQAILIGRSKDKFLLIDSLVQRDAGKWLARHGSAAEIETALAAPDLHRAFRHVFLDQIDPDKLTLAAIPLLQKLAQDNIERTRVLHLLVWRASQDDLNRIWLSYLKDKSICKEAARYMVACIQRDAPEVVLEYLKADDLVPRGTAVLQLAVYRDGLRPHVFRNAQNLRYRAVVKQLCSLLDDPDNVIKLAAMCVLSDIFREGEAPAALASATEKIKQYSTSSKLISPDETEAAEINAVRSTVKMFLDDAEKHAQ